MNERWQRLDDLFERALGVPREDRERVLAEACPDDAVLRAEVASLLEAHDHSPQFLQEPEFNLHAVLERFVTGQMAGPYRMEREIGRGGGGVVYLAEDTRLGRLVALKVLPRGFCDDPVRRERIRREARIAATLTHPGVATVYALEEFGSDVLLATEYVEGESLRARLARGPLQLDELVDTAIQVTEALAAAHERGIVHRDLKPENLVRTPAGRIKLLDFGVALSTVSAQPGRTRLTAEGTIIGTPGYLSPEQVDGEDLDGRSDIFGLGIVLYELATGVNPFAAKTITGTARALAAKPPPLADHNPAQPPALDRVIRRCLAIAREERYQRAEDLRSDLLELARPQEQQAPTSVQEAEPVHRRLQNQKGGARGRILRVMATTGRAGALLAVAALILAAATGRLSWFRRDIPAAPAASAGQARAGLPLQITRITTDTRSHSPAISDTGWYIAYVSDKAEPGNADIWISSLVGGADMRLTSHPAMESSPAFSPGGSTVAFRSERDGGGIYAVSRVGGEERLLVPGGRSPRYSPDGKWLAYWEGDFGLTAGSRRMFVIPAEGGTPRRLRADFGVAGSPVWLPDSRRLLFAGGETKYEDLWITPLDDGPASRTGAFRTLNTYRFLFDFEECCALDQTGLRVLLWALGDDVEDIWALRLSPESWQVAGEPERVTAGMGSEGLPPSTAADGTFAFSRFAIEPNIWALPLDARAGKVLGPPTRVVTPTARTDEPSLLRDGRLLAFTVSPETVRQQVRVKNLIDGTERAGSLPDSPGKSPALAPDGSAIAYTGGKGPAHISIRATSGGPEKEVRGTCAVVFDWTPNGRGLLCGTVPQVPTLLVSDIGSGAERRLFPDTERFLDLASLSGDGRWVSFVAWPRGESRRLFVAPFRLDGPVSSSEWIPITSWSGNDGESHWGPDDSGLYFKAVRDGVMGIWMQPLSPTTKRPAGQPVRVLGPVVEGLHVEDTAYRFPTFAVARDRLIVTLHQKASDVWMARPGFR